MKKNDGFQTEESGKRKTYKRFRGDANVQTNTKLQPTDENVELMAFSYLIGDKTVKNNSFKFLCFRILKFTIFVII